MIRTDCATFPLDRPCRIHKDTGVRCSSCSAYAPFFRKADKKKLLIVKLGAMGDVLRTTFLLEGLARKYPKYDITWVVAPQSVPILENNHYVARVWPFGTDTFSRLAAEKFDVVVNMDLSPESLALATFAFAKRRVGYWLDGCRRVQCSNEAARRWLEMSAFDDVKKKNEFTYQYWMSRIAVLPRSNYEIRVPLVPASVKRAKDFARRKGLAGKTVIGINPGAGKRWKLKKWTDAGYLAVIRQLAAEGKKIILLGGPEEAELIAKLARRSGGRVVNAGTENSLPDFFALINLCDLLITGDTMAMHAALGLKKKVVAVFGPTSAAEIEMYGRGRKIVSPALCVCCYRQACDVKPDCMHRIPVEAVYNAVRELI